MGGAEPLDGASHVRPKPATRNALLGRLGKMAEGDLTEFLDQAE